MLTTVLLIVAQAVGTVVLLLFVYSLITFFSFWLLPIKPLTAYKRSSGQWALITGSSAGIGFAYAQELAARGFNIILLGHLPEELEAARKTILAESPAISVSVKVCDAIKATNEDIAALAKSISDLPVTILINNVGGTPIAKPHHRLLSTYAPAEVDASINLNSRFMSQLTQALLSSLTSAKERVLILNISSGGKLGLPGLIMYSATKGYVHSFSLALSREAKAFDLPLDVLSIVPGDVESQANNVALMPGSPTARQFAKKLFDLAPRAVSRGYMELSPWMQHAIQLAILPYLPESILFDSVLKGFHEKRKALEELAKKET